MTKIDMHKNLPDDENGKMIKSMIPQYQEMTSTLFFNESESLFRTGEGTGETHDESNLDEEGNGVQVTIKMDTPDEKIYTDVKKGIVVEQRELMDKTFLIKDTIDPGEWRVTGESKMVSGLNCMKAVMDSENGPIEAWFTSQVPVSTGPGGFGGLPGLIVHLSMEDGGIQVTATNIIGRELKKDEITAPTQGKTISRKKFAKLEQKKMEQMRKQYGGGDGEGNVIIMTTE